MSERLSKLVRTMAMAAGCITRRPGGCLLFGVGVSGSSRSDRQATTKDGDIMSCRQATKDAAAPPEDCQAILRLDLAPLREAPRPGPEESDEASMSASPPAPLPLDAHASTNSGARGKKPRPGSAAASSPSPPRASRSAAPPPPAEDEAPQCPPGMAWTGVKCKAK